MGDPWGGLTVLIKKQQHNINRKAKIKYLLQKKKESYLKENSNNKLVFPEIPDFELEKIKTQIRKDLRKQRIKEIIFNIFLLISTILLFYLIISNINF